MSSLTEPFSEPRPARGQGHGEHRPAARQPVVERIIIEVGTLEGVALATSAVESIAYSHGRGGTQPPDVEVLTPFPFAFAGLTGRHAFVSVRHVAVPDDDPTPQRAFAVRMISGPDRPTLTFEQPGGLAEVAALAETDPAIERPGPLSPWPAERPTGTFAVPGAGQETPTGTFERTAGVFAMLPEPGGPHPTWRPPALPSDLPGTTARPAPTYRPGPVPGLMDVAAPRGTQPSPVVAGAGGVAAQPGLARRSRVTRRAFLLGSGAVLLGAGGLWAASRRRDDAPETGPRPLWPVNVRPLIVADFFLRPLIEDAWQRRATRQRADIAYNDRIVEPLNRERYNALLFGWGEEHGETYADYAGSVSVLSFDIRAGLVDSISLSRDIRAPELERIMGDRGQRARVLRHAFQVGMRANGGSVVSGFSTLRQVVESMTGLAIDHQFLVKDIFLRDFIVVLTEKLGRPLQVMVDKPHVFAGFRLAGRDYVAGAQVQAGRQNMDSFEAMRYVLAEDQHPVGRQDERSYRKSALFRAMLDHLQTIVQNDIRRVLTPFSKSILDDLLGLLTRERDNGAIVVEDSELQQKIVQLFDRQFWLGEFAEHVVDGNIAPGKVPSTSTSMNLQRSNLVIHDPYFGNGGVLRVHNIRDNVLSAAHPTIQQEVMTGILSNPELGWMLIPPGGDPYAQNLIRDYWGPVRERVRQALLPG